jgi:hypothetical protein
MYPATSHAAAVSLDFRLARLLYTVHEAAQVGPSLSRFSPRDPVLPRSPNHARAQHLEACCLYTWCRYRKLRLSFSGKFGRSEVVSSGSSRGRSATLQRPERRHPTCSSPAQGLRERTRGREERHHYRRTQRKGFSSGPKNRELASVMANPPTRLARSLRLS